MIYLCKEGRIDLETAIRLTRSHCLSNLDNPYLSVLIKNGDLSIVLALELDYIQIKNLSHPLIFQGIQDKSICIEDVINMKYFLGKYCDQIFSLLYHSGLMPLKKAVSMTKKEFFSVCLQHKKNHNKEIRLEDVSLSLTEQQKNIISNYAIRRYILKDFLSFERASTLTESQVHGLNLSRIQLAIEFDLLEMDFILNLEPEKIKNFDDHYIMKRFEKIRHKKEEYETFLTLISGLNEENLKNISLFRREIAEGIINIEEVINIKRFHNSLSVTLSNYIPGIFSLREAFLLSKEQIDILRNEKIYNAIRNGALPKNLAISFTKEQVEDPFFIFKLFIFNNLNRAFF